MAASAFPASETALNFATGLMVREEYGLAIDELNDILERDPGFVRMDVVLFRLGESYFQSDAADKAIATFQQLTEKHPDSNECPQALYRLGQLLSAAAPDQAAAAYLLLADRWAEHNLAAPARYWAGDALLRDKRFAEAEATLRQVIETTPDADFTEHARYALGWAVVQQDNRLADALEAFEAFITAHPDSPQRPAAALKIAECLYRLDRHDQALTAYQALLDETGPIGRDAALGVAWSLFDLTRYAEAIDAFLLAATRQEDPERQATAVYNAANAALRAPALERAAVIFGDFVQRFPQHNLADDARFRQGHSLLRTGAPAEAEPVLAELAARLGPPHVSPPALFALAEAQAALDRKQDAAATFQQLAAHHPEHPLAPVALYTAALALDDAGNPEAAATLAEELLQRYPDSDLVPLTRFALGESRFRLGRYAAALEAFEAAAEAPPETHNDRRYKMAWSLFHLDRPADALPHFLHLAEADPPSPLAAEARYMAGRCARSLDDDPQAQAHFTQCIAQFADSPFAARATLALAAIELETADASTTPGAQREAAVARLETLLQDDTLDDAVRRFAFLTLAQALQQLDRHAEALVALEALTALGGPVPETADEAAFTQAWSHYQLGNLAAAQTGFAALAQQAGPRAADAAYWQARTLEDRESAQAADSFAAFLAAFPDSRWSREARYREALSRTRAGQTEAAGTAFRQLVDDDPASPFAPIALYDLAWLYRQSADTPEAQAQAEAAFAELVEAYPASDRTADSRYRLAEYAQNRGDLAEALAGYQAVLADGGFDHPDTLRYRIAWCHLGLEQFPQAVTAFQTLATTHPDSPLASEAHYRAGHALQRLKRYAEAIQAYDAVGPDSAFAERAAFGAAESSRADGRTGDAVERYRRVLADFPEGPFRTQATLGLGHSLRQAGAQADALEAYAAVAAMTDAIEAAQACLGSGYSRLAMDQPRAAAREFLKVDILYGYDALKPEALRMLIQCFERMDDTEKADHYRRELATRFPEATEE